MDGDEANTGALEANLTVGQSPIPESIPNPPYLCLEPADIRRESLVRGNANGAYRYNDGNADIWEVDRCRLG
jgi:hypothetical protein